MIDENALARLLESGDIAGAGLDVFEHEPAVNPKLLKLAKAGKVVLLPHMGSATIEGRVDMGEKVIINIKTFMDGHRPPDRVLAVDALDVGGRTPVASAARSSRPDELHACLTVDAADDRTLRSTARMNSTLTVAGESRI